MNTVAAKRTIRRWDEINGVYVEERVPCSGFSDMTDGCAPKSPVDDNPLKNAEMTLEDDYDSIDGIINNGSKKDNEEKFQEEQKSVKDKIREHEEKIKALSREPQKIRKPSLCRDRN
ncbi:DUF4316 domain-containing protein [Oribacterium sp. P6A1]|uniref:DUF4316 domain-containing protein n=1 Tax=Oribacterium sp. P6A1 TaxID=1410612 RepID=UPI00056297DB|nr:DUF4316 domain-containing protein [Oribacterium sp. P6A1]